MTAFSAVRQSLSSRIALIGGDWNASPVPWHVHATDDVPDAVPASMAHLSYAIGTNPERYPDRGTGAGGTWTTTATSVRFFARYLPHDGIASEDAALDHENDLIAQVVSTPTLQITWERSDRSMTSSGEWFSHDVEFNVFHRTATS